MRLTPKEAQVIKNAILHRDPLAEVYLFGSRVDDRAKGGDIDILILSQVLDADDKRAIRIAIFQQLEEQKIDLVLAKDDSDPFIKIALATGVPL